MTKLIKWSEVSRILCRDRSSITEKRISKKHRPAVDKLVKFCDEWEKEFGK